MNDIPFALANFIDKLTGIIKMIEGHDLVYLSVKLMISDRKIAQIASITDGANQYSGPRYDLLRSWPEEFPA